MELTLTSPVQYVPRVGPSMAGKLRKLGIETVRDLLTYVPFRYNDYSLVSKIARVQPGETVTVLGKLESIKTFFTKKGKRLVTAKLADDSGRIDIVWFNQPYLLNVLHTGDTVSVSGKVDWFGPKVVFSSPEYEILAEESDGKGSLHTGRFVPVYPETSGLSSKWLRGRIAFVLEQSLHAVTDELPPEIIAQEHLMDIQTAIRAMHFPTDLIEADRARERLAFEELFLLLLRAYEQKHQWQTTLTSHAIKLSGQNLMEFMTALPFVLTSDQQTAVKEILSDLGKPIPMNRMLEGDVGSGKTVVAAAAIYASYTSGFSSLLMAPTQILAQQHANTLEMILGTHGIPVELVVGGKKSKTKPTLGPRVLVGTHALLTSDGIPSKIGIIIIDEQQRFGVEQRATLRSLTKSVYTPHQLTMTATPIPRTLVQTVFGNLDLSVLETLPSGRTPVKTWVVPKEKRASAYVWIDKELAKAHSQAFIVCPLIDESESLSTVKAATAEFTRLKRDVFPARSVGLLHGRMKPAEKNQVLDDFRQKKYDILVSTPVVEVGIDIPNATLMVIEAAERFGLSQLHQLRGRVGRSDKASYCLLFTENETDVVLTRLKAMESVHSGPKLAELDLSLRGPGELFGTRQHGVPGLTLASLSDTALVARAQKHVRELIARDPDLTEFAHLRLSAKRDTIETTQA